MIKYYITYKDLISQKTSRVGFALENPCVRAISALRDAPFIEIISIEGM